MLGEKSVKGQTSYIVFFLLVGALIPLTAENSNAQVNGCCMLQDGCEIDTDGVCPAGATRSSNSCEQLLACQIGCCCSAHEPLVRTANSCMGETGSPLTSVLSNFDPTFDMVAAEEQCRQV